MVGADKTTKLWRPPTIFTFLLCRLCFLDFRLLDLPLKSVYNIYPSVKYCLPAEEKLLLQKMQMDSSKVWNILSQDGNFLWRAK